MAQQIKLPQRYRILFRLAKLLGYEVRVDRGTPFIAPYTLGIYIKKDKS